ncbi:MAG: arylsulfatase [Verrucomicrobiales bacterium]
MTRPFPLSFSALLATTLLAWFVPSANAEVPSSKSPNIILIMTDDQGYGDISAHGNPILKTPNLDRLRGEAVALDNFLVSPTCAPTRSATHTGRHDFMNGVTHTILERERLTLDAITLPQVLSQSGYATGIFGKWHLGDEDAYQPSQRGFSESFIHGAGGIGQSYPGSCGDAPGNKYFDPVIRHNGKFIRTEGYCTDLFFTQARLWMKTQHEAGKPFFANITTNAPHSPYIAREQDAALYLDKVPDRQTAHFYGMIHNIDENIGKLMDDLKAMGIERDTLVIFTNDNGTAQGEGIFNAGMRGKKGTPWLGGTRVSSFWRWPGRLKPGIRKQLTAHIDVFPTLAEIAGATLTEKAKKQIEGRSLLPLLGSGDAEWPDRKIFTHVGRWPKSANPDDFKFSNTAVRNSRWALVSIKGGKQSDWQLFDLEKDPGQQSDVAAGNPEVVKYLAGAFDEWWARCLPKLVNEKVVGPKINPFAAAYYQQFGGEPTKAELKRMNPDKPGK